MGRLGYACMNRTLRDRDEPIRCNRSLQKKTLNEHGLDYVSELVVQNLHDLKKTLQWNLRHEIYFYRCTSDLFPWNSEYEVEDLPRWKTVDRLTDEIGTLIRSNDIRFTFHPSHYVKLATPSVDEDGIVASTLENSIRDLEIHARWLDLLGLPETPYYSINIHIGAHYDNKDRTAERFRQRVQELPSNVRNRLTVENDDNESLWSIPELVDAVGDLIPVVFDHHHHKFTDRGLTYQEAFEQTLETWDDVRPIAHYSEARGIHQNDDFSPQAHSDYVYNIPDWLLEQADVMIEAKKKEQALLAYRDRFSV